ncbi:MAG: tetratricopeptide repeat protein [Casimicrobium sp.]
MNTPLRLLILLVLLSGSQLANAQSTECQTGWVAFKAKSYVRASEDITRCLAGDLSAQARAAALQVRAQSYFEQKRIDLAIKDQKASLEYARPKDVWPYVMLGAYYREANDYEAAISSLREAMKYDEDGPGTGPGMAVHYHLGQTLHRAKRYNEAIDAFTKGIRKQPEYGYALYRRALSYEALGKMDLARRDFARAAELVPKDGYEAEIASKLKTYGSLVKVRPD